MTIPPDANFERIGYAGIAIIVVVLAVTCFLNTNNDSGRPQAVAAVANQPKPLGKAENLPEVPLPENGHGFCDFDKEAMTSFLSIKPQGRPQPQRMPGMPANMPVVDARIELDDFTIENGHVRWLLPKGPKGHVLVKVEREGKLVCWFFVREDDSYKTPIPSGTYNIKYASGEKWYGDKHIFGRGGDYREITSPINIPENTDFQLYLTPRRSGTIKDRQLDGKDF